ncbi:MAG TPA: serine/threonine-protein kinase, partial [Gammaproteobacteria bacterium]
MPGFLKSKTVWSGVVILGFALLALFQGGMNVEWAGYSVGRALAPARAVNSQVAVVAIDAPALKQFGPWPWPRSVLAKLVDTLGDDKAGVIALTEDLSSPQNAVALDYLSQLQPLAAGANDAPVTAKLAEAQAALDTDAALVTSLVHSGRVLIAARGSRTSSAKAQSSGSPPFVLPIDAPDAPAVSLDAPLSKFANAARGVGFLDETSGATPVAPLLVQYDGHAVATLALLAAAREQDIETNRMGVQPFGGITLGTATIRTDRSMQVLTQDQAAVIPRFGAAEVLAGSMPAEKLAGKVVLVGRVETERAPALAAASLVSGLLNGDLVSTPFWAWGLRALLVLAAGLYLTLLLPHLGRIVGIGLTAFLALALLLGEYVPLISQSLWLPLMLPLWFLVLGYCVLAAAHFVRERGGISRGTMSELNREYALALQALNRFDQAFQRFRLCLPSRMLCDNLMNLGQEHERGRRYSQALEVYAYVQRIAPTYEGLGERLERLRQLESTPSLTRTGAASTLSRALNSGGVQKPMLGRYELMKELGRGAMGIVYLGKDAKIGRQVAIKTLALSDEFDGEALKDVHDRFFREAETAGRLNHSNIVTIYDVGEDQGLAYIAMDFLQGDSLQKYTDSKELLPMGEALAVAIKVAEGLDYAHKHHVVHRDIKPANIMYDRGTGRVKI